MPSQDKEHIYKKQILQKAPGRQSGPLQKQNLRLLLYEKGESGNMATILWENELGQRKYSHIQIVFH